LSIKKNQLLTFTDKGIYCKQGDFYIDPWRGVDKAIITHAHSDHARWGSKSYLSHKLSEPILRLRLGRDINLQTIDYNETLFLNGVKISLHPAGHIIGSAQVRVEYEGEVWVASGDYKIEYDGVSEAFEPVKCNVFITESTFGLPVYRWQSQKDIIHDINNWWWKNKNAGKQSILTGYSLGKAQRILENIEESIGNIYLHGAIDAVQNAFIDFGIPLKKFTRWTSDMPKDKAKNALIVAPPSAAGSPWLKKFEPYSLGICSGWMQIKGNQRRRNADAGFILSDHADWNGLIAAVKATEAQKVFVTHGYTSIFSRFLNEVGIESDEVKTEYGGENEEIEVEKIVSEIKPE